MKFSLGDSVQILFLTISFNFTTTLMIGCTQKIPPPNMLFASEKLKTQLLHRHSTTNSTVSYLASFATEQEASTHSAQIASLGGKVENLDRLGKIQKTTIPVGLLDKVILPLATPVSLNTSFAITHPQSENLKDATKQEDLIQSVLAAKKVVGVDALLSRFPTADGRGLKVAVFDTGIDFGVEGIFQNSRGEQKLIGFYDFSGFGKVAPQLLENDSPKKSYAVGNQVLTFSDSISPRKIQSIGTLDAQALANGYHSPAGVDLDGKGKKDAKLVFAVGINAEGLPAVWIDIDQSGVISSRDREELTDFNKTYKYIDLRTDVAPSGARPLAVTINSPNAIQFHSVPQGHGTSCSMIIAGEGYANGRLKGMAPQAKLLSYVLDMSGEDVYNLDQLLRMFEHAKEQKADAISISFTFATADLESARFLADFLDREIASAGIVIGIAAGNEGPGLRSSSSIDYVPHNGFSVGALISKDQAKNVYGWTGNVEDSVVFYSGIGPTRGGRQAPDIVSPLMTWVRGERGIAGPQFHAFSGTSSATPALVGAITALKSALLQNGEQTLDTRVLKLAIQNSTKTLEKVEAIRQGSGVINVHAAFDLYKKLIGEIRAAQNDPKKRTAFAYELRASTQLQNSPLKGEGIHFFGYIPNASISVSMTDDTLKWLDQLTTIEPLILSHQSQLFDIPAVLPMQVGGAQFTLQFNPTLSDKPGVYTDVISVRRPTDNLLLLQIPVVIQIPINSATSSSQGTALGKVNEKFAPFDVARYSIRLTQEEAIEFEGVVQQPQLGRGSSLVFSAYGEEGTSVYQTEIPVTRSSQIVKMKTPLLPAGYYHFTISRNFDRPAVLEDIDLSGQFHTPFAEVIGTLVETDRFNVVLKAKEILNISKATLILKGKTLKTLLSRSPHGNLVEDSPAFVGELPLDQEYDSLGLAIRQTEMDLALHPIINASVALLSAKNESLFRGWVDSQKKGSPSKAVTLNTPSNFLSIVAYPNITHWDTFLTQKLILEVDVPFKKDLSVEIDIADGNFDPQKIFPLTFQLPKGSLSADEHSGLYGILELIDSDETLLDTVPVRVQD